MSEGRALGFPPWRWRRSASVSAALATTPPAIILMAGLQGAGKTTSVGKLAKLLKEQHKKKVLVVSVDVYRPAAIEQLKTLAAQVGVDFFASDLSQKPVDIALGRHGTVCR